VAVQAGGQGAASGGNRQALLEDLLDIVFYLALVGATVGVTSPTESRTGLHSGGRDGDSADERLPRGASPLAQPGTGSFPRVRDQKRFRSGVDALWNDACRLRRTGVVSSP
jgi:hypothetical protein